jgi:hypothetical protein
VAESIALHPLLSKLWDASKNGAAASVPARSNSKYRAVRDGLCALHLSRRDAQR